MKLRKMMIALAISMAAASCVVTEASAHGGGGHGGGGHGGGGHGGGGHGHGGFGRGFGFGFGYPGYYGYGPSSSYYDEDEQPICYHVRRRVHTRHGWRIRRFVYCQ